MSHSCGGSPTWFWRCAEWGCKWPAQDVDLDDDGETATLQFDTPWDPPTGIVKALRERFPDENEYRQIADEYRIGINLGDVMIDGEDIYGDGINVAARIEALAEPGGVWLSHTVHDQIRDRMDLNLEDMGEVADKNIARPVRVFRVLAEGRQSSTPARWAGTPWLKYASNSLRD